MTRFIVAPQWQGSPSTRAMQLVDGAAAIAEDLPRSVTTILEAPHEAGDALGGTVRRLSALQQMRERLDNALADTGTDPVLVVGGDCGVSVAAAAHAAARAATTGERLAVVWADAHPDLHSPDSSTSHAFSGMSLRAILGEGPESLRLPPGTVAPTDLVLVGARAIDDAEAEFIALHGIRTIAADALSDPHALADAVRATAATAVFVHVDVDVLDPDEMPGVKSPEPFGVRLADLVGALKELRAEVPVVASAITEFLPASRDAASADLGTILRIVGALA